MDMDMQHGHGHEAWTWTCSMDMHMLWLGIMALFEAVHENFFFTFAILPACRPPMMVALAFSMFISNGI
jgi:hypothetical protein